jgi:hypothetical protein
MLLGNPNNCRMGEMGTGEVEPATVRPRNEQKWEVWKRRNQNGHNLRERQGFVLTDQSLGIWKKTSAERGAEGSFLADCDNS